MNSLHKTISQLKNTNKVYKNYRILHKYINNSLIGLWYSTYYCKNRILNREYKMYILKF